MAKLFFRYSSMDAGKSTALLQASHNYNQGGLNTILFTAAIDDRYNVGEITSRIGISAKANTFTDTTNIFEEVQSLCDKSEKEVGCILIDECQFLTRSQVAQLTQVVDDLDIGVMCYGLRTDFLGELFEGSKHLLAWADHIEQVVTICSVDGCKKRAHMVLRKDENGNYSHSGDQISIGGNDSYQSVCRKHYIERLTNQKRKEGLDCEKHILAQ